MTKHAHLPTHFSRFKLTRLRMLLAGVLTVMSLALILGLWTTRRNSDSIDVQPSPTPPIPHDLAPAAIRDPAFPSLTYSVHTFLWWNETMRTLDLDNIRLMNFTHVKQRFAWSDVQPVEGAWHWDQADGVVAEVEHRGLYLIARLDGPPDWAIIPPPEDDPTIPPVDLDAWALYCGTLAARYKGQIAGYQVWNEPNLNREWLDYPPNAAGYVTLLAACAQAIRAADPEAVIISAGLAPTGTQLPQAIPDIDYLRMIYQAGAAPWFDVLGLNAPGYGNPPTRSPDAAEKSGDQRWMVFRHVEDMRAIMVQAGDAHKQVAILELGWTTDPIHAEYAWHAVSEEQQAKYLVGAYRYAAKHWRPWVGVMVTIFIADLDWTEDDEEYWWAINRAGYGTDWQGRPAYYQLSWMEQYRDDEFTPARDPGQPDAMTVDPITPREDEQTTP